MNLFTEEQAKAILDKVLALSTADDCTATLTGNIDGNIRFALNAVSTSGIVENAQLVVQSAFGKRVGTATTNTIDDASLLLAATREHRGTRRSWSAGGGRRASRDRRAPRASRRSHPVSCRFRAPR